MATTGMFPQSSTGGMSLRTKLFLALGTLCVLTALVAGLTAWGIQRIEGGEQTLDQVGERRDAARQVSIQSLLLRRYEKDLFLNLDDATARNDYRAKWDDAYTGLQQAIADFDAAAATDEDRQQVARWQAASTTYQQAFGEVTDGITSGRITTPDQANDVITPAKEDIRVLSDGGLEVGESLLETSEQTSAELDGTLERIHQTVLGVGGLALVLGIIGSFLLARHLLQPIMALQGATQRLASGELATRVNLKRRDEFGALGRSFDTMAQSLQERVMGEQQAQAEAQRLRQQEQASRQQLEATVDDYLRFAQQVAQGNLQERLHVQQTGAIGQLGQGLNSMVESLQAVTQQVQQATANITTAAAEILAATTQQAASATEQSAAITQTTTTVEEVKAIALQTAQQANQLAQQSHQMLDAAQQGTYAVDQTVDGMGLIRERVDSIAHTILALSEQTTAIGEITETVTDLADQSNLLALNAAIEAARAGEQGKGFAVVAQHVRELAERSKNATAQVGQILNEIQRATSAAVMVTEEGTKGVTQGAELAGKAGQVIVEIAHQVERGAQSNVQVAAAAQQQTAGMDQIGQAMGAIQQATTETLASTRQAERAAKDLNALAASLQQAVATYQV